MCAKIKKITWEDCNFKEIKSKIGYLDTVYLVIQTEGIPVGDKLSITIWEDEYFDGHGSTSRNMGTLQVSVGKNGKAELILSTAILQAYRKKLNDKDWFNESEHEYYIQIKYKNEIDTIEDKTQIKIKNKLEQLIKPQNGIKPNKVSSSSTPTPPSLVKVIKAEFTTKYDVCSDLVMNFDDYKNFYVLQSEDKCGYHWLSNGTRTYTDKDKPMYIPITLSSTAKMKVTLTLVSHSEKQILIRLKDKAKNYKFDYHTIPQKRESEVVFTSVNTPFENTIQYFKIYDLIPEYSLDAGKKWKSMGEKVQNRLYITKEKPPWEDFDKYFSHFEKIKKKDYKLVRKEKEWKNEGYSLIENTGDLGLEDEWYPVSIKKKPYLLIKYPERKDLSIEHYIKKYKEQTSLLVRCNKNDRKPNILESLLFISCSSKFTSYKDENIVEAIFKHISSLKIKRARLDEPLGYWRNSSALDPTWYSPRTEDFNNNSRSVRFLLRVGDGRCGEFAEFFIALCRIQGVTGVVNFSFEIKHTKNLTSGPGYQSKIFLVKSWEINDPYRPVDKGGKAQGNNTPMNFFNDHVFTVYNGKFYDPSYGLKGKLNHSDLGRLNKEELLAEYSSMALQGVPFAKPDEHGQKFFDNIHSGYYVDVRSFKTSKSECDILNCVYKTEQSELENYLDISL
jgi:hypothetical protein